MIIQNFAQLDDVYGKEEAETIKGNCGNIVYLITTELKALEEISKMCGEEKSKKDDKTASTPLVTVSDLQRMKQFEVIILRLRKQPFKTKFTPYFKLDWGVKYPPAKYPSRKKEEVHTFDIKEFVKTQKKKKLLEMMNAADDRDKEISMSSGIVRDNPFADQLPPALQVVREETKEMPAEIPNFLRRIPEKEMDEEENVKTPTKAPKIPDFETFKREMESTDLGFNPFQSTVVEEDDDDSEGLDFDVDELVKKIDAKIAELEAEEKKAKEEAEKTEKENAPEIKIEQPAEENNSINEVKEEIKPVPTPVNLNLDDDSEDDDFFDDFFDN